MQRPAGLAGWFRQHWQWLAVSSAAVLMAAGVIIADFIPGGVQEDATTIVAATPAPSKESEIDRLARAASESPEFAALIQNAEMLLASDVNDIWLSDSSAY